MRDAGCRMRDTLILKDGIRDLMKIPYHGGKRDMLSSVGGMRDGITST